MNPGFTHVEGALYHSATSQPLTGCFVSDIQTLTEMSDKKGQKEKERERMSLKNEMVEKVGWQSSHHNNTRFSTTVGGKSTAHYNHLGEYSKTHCQDFILVTSEFLGRGLRYQQHLKFSRRSQCATKFEEKRNCEEISISYWETLNVIVWSQMKK